MKAIVKGRLQGIIATALVGAMAAGTAAFAFGDNKVRVFVDNKEAYMTDAAGNVVNAFVEEGTTYIPLRAVSQLFNKKVYWDGPNSTVYIGEMGSIVDAASTNLWDLTNISSGYKTEQGTGLKDNYDNVYGNCIYNYYAHEHYRDEYMLKGQYRFLRGTLFVRNGESDETMANVTITADGAKLGEYTIGKLDKPIPIDVNVTGYNDLKIEIDGNKISVGLADMKLYQ